MKELTSPIKVYLNGHSSAPLDLLWDENHKCTLKGDAGVTTKNIYYFLSPGKLNRYSISMNVRHIIPGVVMLYDLSKMDMSAYDKDIQVFLAKVMDFLQCLDVEEVLYITVGDIICKHLEAVGFKPLETVVNPRTNNELKSYSINIAKFNYNEFVINYKNNNPVQAANTVKA